VTADKGRNFKLTKDGENITKGTKLRHYQDERLKKDGDQNEQ